MAILFRSTVLRQTQEPHEPRNMSTKLSMTIDQLQDLLTEQKRLVVERLQHNTYQYNAESTDDHAKSLKINREKMQKVGMEAGFPNTFTILKAYLP